MRVYTSLLLFDDFSWFYTALGNNIIFLQQFVFGFGGRASPCLFQWYNVLNRRQLGRSLDGGTRAALASPAGQKRGKPEREGEAVPVEVAGADISSGAVRRLQHDVLLAEQTGPRAAEDRVRRVLVEHDLGESRHWWRAHAAHDGALLVQVHYTRHTRPRPTRQILRAKKPDCDGWRTRRGRPHSERTASRTRSSRFAHTYSKHISYRNRSQSGSSCRSMAAFRLQSVTKTSVAEIDFMQANLSCSRNLPDAFYYALGKVKEKLSLNFDDIRKFSIWPKID